MRPDGGIWLAPRWMLIFLPCRPEQHCRLRRDDGDDGDNYAISDMLFVFHFLEVLRLLLRSCFLWLERHATLTD